MGRKIRWLSMQGYPILGSSLEDKLTSMENRVRRLGQPHKIAIVEPLGDPEFIFINAGAYGSPLNVWTRQSSRSGTLRGTYATLYAYNNRTEVANQQYEVRYYQETPTVPDEYYLLTSGTFPLASTSPAFAIAVNIATFSPVILGTYGRLELWSKRVTDPFPANDYVEFEAQWLLGGAL